MAIDLSKRQIKALPVQGYDAVRDSLHSGDLVFCSGSYLFSGLIQRFTKSVWSHVGVIYRDEHLGRVFVLDPFRKLVRIFTARTLAGGATA